MGLDTVHQGVRLDLESLPIQLRHPQRVQMTDAMQVVCGREIEGLVSKGAAIRILLSEEGFVSIIFFIPKGSRGFRPEISLKPSNVYIRYVKILMKLDGEVGLKRCLLSCPG